MPPQYFLHCCEMLERFLIQLVHQFWRARDQFLHRRVLAVEDAQRIAVQTPRRIRIQTARMLPEIRDQFFAVAQARSHIAQRVELQRHIAYAQLAPQPRAHQDHLGIDVRPGKAQRLHSKLMKLAVAPLLRALVAEHRPL